LYLEVAIVSRCDRPCIAWRVMRSTRPGPDAGWRAKATRGRVAVWHRVGGNKLTTGQTRVQASAAELQTRYGVRVFGRERWDGIEIDALRQAVDDLSWLMGGSSAFRRELRWVRIWRTNRRTWMAAMAAPVLGVVYFRGASWGDAAEFKWQTVHELAHAWDIHSCYRLSRGLKNATGGRYGRFRWQSPIPFEYKPGGRWLKGRRPPLNALEDWADSVATYVYPEYAESAPGGPRLISPARWNYIRQQMQVRLPYSPHWVTRFYGPEGLGPVPI